jgi:hypothetical protein
MANELGMQAIKVTGTIGGVETVRSLGLMQSITGCCRKSAEFDNTA